MTRNRGKLIAIQLCLFIIYLPLFTFGAENSKIGSKLYVGPTTGVNVRDLPDNKATILAKLNFNTVVTIIADSLPAQPFQIMVTDYNSGKLTLKGHWVKVSTGNITGYIFDGMLSRYKGLNLNSMEEELYYTTIFGKHSLKIIKKSIIIQGRNFNYETKIKSYPRGFTTESTFFDDCYELVYTLGIPFNEAYWLIQRLLWDADAAQNIKIKKLNGKTVLSFDSCT